MIFLTDGVQIIPLFYRGPASSHATHLSTLFSRQINLAAFDRYTKGQMFAVWHPVRLGTPCRAPRAVLIGAARCPASDPTVSVVAGCNGMHDMTCTVLDASSSAAGPRWSRRTRFLFALRDGRGGMHHLSLFPLPGNVQPQLSIVNAWFLGNLDVTFWDRLEY